MKLDMGGIMVFELSSPESPCFVQYLNHRDLGYNIGDDIDAGN